MARVVVEGKPTSNTHRMSPVKHNQFCPAVFLNVSRVGHAALNPPRPAPKISRRLRIHSLNHPFTCLWCDPCESEWLGFGPLAHRQLAICHSGRPFGLEFIPSRSWVGFEWVGVWVGQPPGVVFFLWGFKNGGLGFGDRGLGFGTHQVKPWS